MKKRKPNPFTRLIKQRFLKWYANHPDVKQFAQVYYNFPNFENNSNFQAADISPLWFVINLMGDLIEWQDSPTEWIEQFEEERNSDRAQKKV